MFSRYPIRMFSRDAKHFGTYLLLHLLLTIVGVFLLWDHPRLTYNLGTASAFVGAVAGWAFVIRYSREFWEETEAGRHLMVFTTGLSAIMTFIVVRNFLELPLIVDYLTRLLIFSFVATHLIWRYRILRRQTDHGRPIDEAVSQLRARPE
jgi:hypothetical protein